GALQQNQKFIVIGEQGDWLRIYYPGDNYPKGWVRNSDDCFTGTTVVNNPIPRTVPAVTPPPTGDTGYVIAINGIDVKAGPGNLFPTIATLPYGTKLRVIAETNVGDQYHGWLEIQLDDGRTGWVPKGLINHV